MVSSVVGRWARVYAVVVFAATLQRQQGTAAASDQPARPGHGFFSQELQWWGGDHRRTGGHGVTVLSRLHPASFVLRQRSIEAM